VSQSVEKKKC